MSLLVWSHCGHPWTTVAPQLSQHPPPIAKCGKPSSSSESHLASPIASPCSPLPPLLPIFTGKVLLALQRSIFRSGAYLSSHVLLAAGGSGHARSPAQGQEGQGGVRDAALQQRDHKLGLTRLGFGRWVSEAVLLLLLVSLWVCSIAASRSDDFSSALLS